ncbi:hypothetical protein LTS14_006141 [Recurvomyces mirabilis]|uniref:uncharacterized protein n=1 Tax=Recurvomyces mirabilis TaxID=574656 RepID=UPI002DDEA041|nr:hypothetical protein LTS14_006141 [Recurvomyces mirabilis]
MERLPLHPRTAARNVSIFDGLRTPTISMQHIRPKIDIGSIDNRNKSKDCQPREFTPSAATLAQEQPPATDHMPHLTLHHLFSSIALPGTPHAKLGIEIGTESPYQRKPPVVLPAKRDNFREAESRVYVKSQLVNVALVINAVLNSSTFGRLQAVVRLVSRQ